MVIPIEVRINKEVPDYQESLFFGLSLHQLLFALLAVLVAVGVYFGLKGHHRFRGDRLSVRPGRVSLRPGRLFHLQRHDL